jgi:hypothetical protein
MIYDGQKVSDEDFQFVLLYMLNRMQKSIEKMGASSNLSAMTNLVNTFKSLGGESAQR